MMSVLAALALFLAVTGAGLPAADAGEPAQTLPPGIPDLTDAETLAHFTPVAQGRLWGDPDFPILLVRGLEATDPPFVLIVLDARNGKDTWSLAEDPMILVTIGKEGDEGPVSYVDEGFVTQGRASGALAGVAGATLGDLAGLLEAGYASATSRQPL